MSQTTESVAALQPRKRMRQVSDYSDCSGWNEPRQEFVVNSSDVVIANIFAINSVFSAKGLVVRAFWLHFPNSSQEKDEAMSVVRRAVPVPVKKRCADLADLEPGNREVIGA